MRVLPNGRLSSGSIEEGDDNDITSFSDEVEDGVCFVEEDGVAVGVEGDDNDSTSFSDEGEGLGSRRFQLDTLIL